MVQHAAILDRRAVRMKARAAAALAVLLPLPALAQQAPDLYARVNEHMTANPAVAATIGKPAPEMAVLDWLIGSWTIEAIVDGKPDTSGHGTSEAVKLYGGSWIEVRDSYAQGNQDIGFVTFSAANGGWRVVAIDSFGNANTAVSAAGWQGDHIVFEGDFLILGVKAHLRQTMTRTGKDEYRVDNEEQLATGWKHLDSYRYMRRTGG